MAEQGKEHKLTQADYNDNLNELYKAAKVTGVTKISMADFSNKMITSPGYRGLIYNGLKKAGVEGIGDNQSDFVSAILPKEKAVAQMALYNENKAKKAASSAPKAKQTQQAAEVGQTMFGGGEETTALQQAQQQVQQIQQANKEQQQGQTREHLDNPQMQSLFGYKNMSNSRVVNDDSLWDENGFKRSSGQPSIEEGERQAKESVGDFMERFKKGEAVRTHIDEKGRLRTDDTVANMQLDRQERNKAVRDNTVGKDIDGIVDTINKEAEDKWRQEVINYTNVVGADPETAQILAKENIDPDRKLKQIQETFMGNISEYLKAHTDEYEKAAQAEGISTAEYVDKYIMPYLGDELQKRFSQKELEKYMPKNMAEYIFNGLQDTIPGMLTNLAYTTQSQRAYQEQANAQYIESLKPQNGSVASEKGGFWDEHKADIAEAGRFGQSLIDPLFAGGMKGGAIAGRGLINLGSKALSKIGLGRVLASDAMKAASIYAKRYGSHAAAGIARVLGSNEAVAKTILRNMPAEMLGQGLGMNIYGALQGGLKTATTYQQQFPDDLTLGEATWQTFTEGLTSREGFVSGAVFGGIMPFMHEFGGLVGHAKGATGWARAKGIAQKSAYEVFSIGATAAAMQLSNETNKWLGGEGFNPTLNGYMHEVAMASAMKYNPSTVVSLARAISNGGWKRFASSLGESTGLGWGEKYPFRFTVEEEREILRATGKTNLKDALLSILPDNLVAKGSASQEEVVRAQTRYLQVLNRCSWDTQKKLAMGLTNSFVLERPRCETFRYAKDEDGNNLVLELDKDGNVLSVKAFKSEEEKEAFLTERSVNAVNEDFWRAYSDARANDPELAEQIFDTVCANNNLSREEVENVLKKAPLRRTDLEWDMIEQIMSELEGLAYPKEEVHVEHSRIEGEKAAQKAEVTSDEPKTEVVNNANAEVTQAMADFAEAMKDATWKEDYEELKKQGMSDADIYNTLMEQYNEAELAPLADYVNAQAKQQGFMQGVANEIEQKTSEQTNLVTSGKVTINGVERTDGRVITLVDADGNIVRLLSGDFKLNEDGTIETEQPIIVSDDNGNPRPLNSVDGWKVAGSTDAGEYASYIRELLGQKATAVIDPNGEFAQPAPTEAPKETPKAGTEVQRNESEGTTEAEGKLTDQDKRLKEAMDYSVSEYGHLMPLQYDKESNKVGSTLSENELDGLVSKLAKVLSSNKGNISDDSLNALLKNLGVSMYVNDLTYLYKAVKAYREGKLELDDVLSLFTDKVKTAETPKAEVEAPKAEPQQPVAEESKPTETKKDGIPLDENGKKNYVADGVRPVDAVNDIYNRGVFNTEQADAYVQSKIEEARKAYDKVNKDIAPKKGEDPDDYLARLQAHDAEVTAAKQVLDRWQAIYDEAHKFDAKEEEAEDAMKTDDIDMRGLEDDPRYFIATHMLKITPESFNEQVGLGAREKRAMPGFLAKKENGGVSIFEATDHIMQFLKDQGITVDEDFVKNTIIDILTSGGPRSYIKNMREEFLANVSREEAYERAKMDKDYLDNYGMEYDEYKDYLEAERQRVSELYRGVDEDALYAHHAEKWQEYEEAVAKYEADQKEIEETLNSKKNGEETGRTETGDGLLRQEGTRNEGRTGETSDKEGSVRPVRGVQDKDGLVPKEASGREAVENLSLEETKAEIGRLQDERDMTEDGAKKAEIQKQIEELQKHGAELVNKEAADYLAESGIKEGDVLVSKRSDDRIIVKKIDGHNVVIELFTPNGRETKTIHGINIKENYDKAEKGGGFFGAAVAKAKTPKVDRLNDTTLSAEERIKGEKPLTEQEIDSLPDELFNDVVKTQIRSALEKLGNGDKLSALEELFYLNALKHVRTTTERGAENSTDANGAQLADGDNARSSNGGEGGETGNVAGERGGETPKEQLRGQDSEGNVRTVSGESGDREVRGGEPADDGVSTNTEQPDRSGEPRSEGSNGGRHGNPSERNQADGEAVRNEIQSSIEARKKKLAELAKRIKKTPKNTPPRLYDAASALGAWIGKQIDSVDFVAVGEFSKETMLLGGDYLRLGIHDFKEWAKRVKGELGDLLKDTFDWKDAEVDDFIREMWNSKYEMDGETHTIAEWASILGDRELRKEISRSLDEKRQLQKDAENIEVKVGDKDNIDQTLPFLLPEQRGDVLKAETAFFGEKHQDRTHGFGKGMMFTNGTGTGKTYTGLGIVKRFVKQGKRRVLIVTPSQPKVADWVKDGQNLGLEVTPLENTKDAGNGVVCTTYANLRANEAVLRDTFDLIVYDESHKIMENKKGEETIGTAVHYQLSNKNKQHAVERVKMKYEPFRKEKELRQELDDTRNIQENAINKLRELDISLPKHPTNSAEIDEHIRAIEQEGENVEGNKEKLNYLRIAKNAFNRLDEIPREIEALKPEQEKLMPEIEKEAEEAVKRTKSVFLSATPFNTRESLKYAEGYLFSYPEENKNTVGTYNHRSPEQAFLEQHFSAGYRWRYGRLEQHMENAEALAKQEVRFSDYLQDQLGTLSTRQIDNGYDYSRTFPTVTLDKAETFNQALQDVFHDKTMQPLWEAFHDVFYDYNKQTALFETMKTALAAERIREHLARGRKVVVFHRRRTTKDELQNPFQQALTIAKVNSENMSAKDKQKVADAIAAFHGKYDDLLKWEQGLDYRLPREQLADIFGEDKVAFFSGEETTKQKNQSIDDFMKDNKGKDIIVIQEASGKEGISLHDQTGEHQRVQISLCLPQSPIAFIQSEGRIYRIGQKSNAVFEYPLLGLNLEINLWAHKFNNALGTTEYLAMGSKARNLSESIAKGIMENSGTIGFDDAGVGGKAYDGNVEAQAATGFDGAITDYFTNQKISAKRENREGADYFPTPEPVGYKMVEWAGLTEGESALEPSAGHGAIARYVPKSNNLTMIEPSQSLMSKLVLNTPGSGRKYEGGTFEDYNVINKHDAIVMNPPYGAGGTTAVEHVAKGFKHLNEGGRLIAIIPDGPACDKKMQKWLESKDAESAVITGEIKLPSCTFGRAGTAVNTRIVVIDKVTREEVRNGMPTRKEVDLRSVTDVNELFEKIRDIDMPERTIDKEYLREKAAKNFRRKIADPDSANKFVVSFVEANQKFVRIDFKRGETSLWIDVEEIQNNKDEALRYYRRIKDRYDTADASFRANRIFTMGRGSNKVEIREADIKRDIYQNAMEFVAKVAGTTVKELDTRNNELMERLRNGSKPTEQPQAEVKPQESRWDYSVVKHTQTGADLHIVKSKERMTDEEYRKELARAKELGGFYDRYSKGFRFETKENADKFMQQEGETRFKEESSEAERLKMSDSPEKFAEQQQRAVEQNGIVMPGLNETEVKIVDVPKHDFEGTGKEVLKSAEKWAKDNIVGTHTATDSEGKTFEYKIGKNSIDKYVSSSSLENSDNIGVHIAVLKKLPEVISNSIEAEVHPDYTKNNEGVRNADNPINNKSLIHRFYGAVTIDGKTYRVKTTMKEYADTNIDKNAYTYEVTKIELIEAPTLGGVETIKDPVAMTSNNSISGAKLLKDVEKEYDKGKKLLEQSKLSDKLQSEVSKLEDKPTVRAQIDTVSKDLNTPCEVHNDASTIKNEKVRKAIESGREVKGWWDKDGVHLYMPNIHSRHDAETTILHETVGHDGLRKLMNGKDGKSRNFQKFLDMVWADKKNTALHEFVKEYAPKNGWDLHEAVDEWLAREAEKPVTDENFGMWGRVKAIFNNALRALGFKSDMSLNDVRYAIWLSKRMKQKPNDPLMKARAAAFRWGMEHSNYKPEVKDGRYVDSEDGKDETRLAASLTPLHTACVQEYNRLLDSRAFRTHEAFTDSMNSLRILQELISGKNYYDIKDSENAYIAENHASSKSEAAWNKFKVQKYQPLEAAINECVGLFGGNPTETIGKMEDYGMKKHGLERNRKLLVRDAIEAITDAKAKLQMTLDWDNERHRLSAELMSGKIDYREYLEGLDNFIRKNIDSSYDPNKNDYSGISAYDPNRIKRGRKVEYDENAIIDDVMDMETLLGDKAQNFWDAVRDATDFAVDYSYETGMIDSKSQDHIKDMFDFYLPLRGFNEETMEDVYDYIGGRGNGADLPIRNAKGRLSEAESPLAHIAKMAMTSITRGEDNKVRQMFYRLVANHPSDAAKVSDVWEVKTKDPVTGNETWEITLPDIPTDATPREIADIMDNFEALMESKKGSGEARKATSRPNYGRVFENKAHASQHIVRTSINGKPKMVYVLGDPRAAQALNGEVVNKNNSHVRKWIINKMAKLSTSYSPEFILSNTSRDTLFANANIASKENAAYYAKFTKNQVIAGTVLSLTGIGGDRLNGESLFEKYYRGHIDTSKPMEKMFAEFMDNGGRTGFLAIQEIENLEKDLKASIKGGRVTDKTKRVAKALWNSIPKGIEQMNMRAELINRFATFMTSRQMGRSILRSVADAKEVSVNFNRKGAGNATEGFIGWSAGALRNNFMFFNASMQSAELLYRNMKGMDSKTIKTTLFMGAVPAAVGTAFAMFLASQEDEEYSNIPSWDRRNNICIPIKGEGYIKIPLPIELRAFWGMGDIIASLTYKRLQTEESPAFAMCGQITQILPIDILESGQMNLTDASGYSPLLPTYVQPLYQYIVNKSWTGKPIEKESKFNPDAPRWTRAYSSTNRFLVRFCKFAHDTFREGKNTAQETDTTGDGWWIDPSLYDHLLKSYFGGAYSIVGKSINTWDNWQETGEIDFAHAPMTSRVWGGFSEKEANATTNAKFWAYKREADNVAKEFSNKENKTNSMAITELKESSRGKRYAIFKSTDKEMQRLRKTISTSKNPDKVAEAEREQKKLRRDLVDALDNVE